MSSLGTLSQILSIACNISSQITTKDKICHRTTIVMLPQTILPISEQDNKYYSVIIAVKSNNKLSFINGNISKDSAVQIPLGYL
jgi:hypothetical protein